MASTSPRDQETQLPLHDGDFHRIPGIGPGIEQRLHAAGIRTFNHLASLTADEICAMLNGIVGMTPERVNNQDWPGKARLLAQELREAKVSFESEEPGERQHYASFLVELLQDEEQAVRRTRVAHVQAGTRDSWAGWDRQRLLDWIQERAEIPMAPEEPLSQMEPAVEQQPPADIPMEEALAPHPSGEERPRAVLPVEVLSAGVVDPRSAEVNPFLYTGSPAQMRLALDMRNTKVERGTPLAYQIIVEAHRMGTTERVRLAEENGEHLMQDEIVLSAPLQGLIEGTYRLTVSARFSPASSTPSEREQRAEKGGLFVFTEGGIIHVFSEIPTPAG